MNELFFLLGLSLSIPLLLALHSHNRRTNTRARLAEGSWPLGRDSGRHLVRAARTDARPRRT